MDQPASEKAPMSEATISITNPANPGDTFTGSASGEFSPDDNTVTCDFWRVPPGPSDPPDVVGSMTMGSGTWSATFDMTGIAATMTGYLRATNETATAQKRNLKWRPPTA